MLPPQVEQARDVCRQPGEHLLMHLLDYSHHEATEDVGVIDGGGGWGFELYSALAVRMDGWILEQRRKAPWWNCLTDIEGRGGPRPTGKRAGTG